MKSEYSVLSRTLRDEILSIRPREVYQDTAIPYALDHVVNYAAAKRDRVTETVQPDLLKRISGLSGRASLAELLGDVEKWLKLFYFGMLYRVDNHIDDIAAAFNERKFSRVPNTTRTLLELFYFLYTTYREIYKLKKESTDPAKTLRGQIAMRDLLVKQLIATRFNWLDPFGTEWKQVKANFEQINILTMQDKLPAETRNLTTRWHAMLSEFCHPNFGSLLYVMDHENSVSPATGTLVFARSPGKRLQLEMTVDLVTAPLAFACLQHVSFLSLFEKILEDYHEGMNRFAQ